MRSLAGRLSVEPGNHTQLAFFARLKQHHLYGVTVAYAVIAGFLIQLASRVLPALGLEAVLPAAIIVLLAGFPVVLVLAWMLIKPKDPVKYSAWQKLHWKLGAALSVAVVVAVVFSGLYTWKFAERRTARLAARQTAGASAAAHAIPAFNPPADSLVVLPFKNLNGDPKQQYFSDGISEELTSALGQNPALRVIAWETASSLRHSNISPGDIGRQLNVANILNGSILRVGDEVRITVELVNAITGYQVWSSHYDGSFRDIFAVQDQVSQAVASALKVKFATADLPAGGTGNPQAHELVLKGRALRDKYNATSLATAQKDFEQAIALDPNYADAHAELASTLIALTERSDLPLKTTLPRARAEAEKALALDPRNAYALTALGIVDSTADPPDVAKARTEFRKALELDPSNAATHGDYGNVLPLKPGLAEFREAALLNPANETAWNNVAVNAQDLGDWALMAQAADTLRKLDPKVVDSAFTLAYAYQQLHQYDKMVSAFDLVTPATTLDRQLVRAGRLTYRALGDSALRPRALAALKRLSRSQANPDVAGNLLQLYLALDETKAALQLLENYCPATPIGCNDLAVSPIYQALHGSPRFEALAKKYTTVTVD
jgi:adenylate cyclase